LAPSVGVVSGAALLVDYVLTITISIASGADAIFSFLPPGWLPFKLPVAYAGIAVLTAMNIRGVKESVTALVPIFSIFIITHAVVLLVTIGGHATEAGQVAQEIHGSVTRTTAAVGLFGALKLLVRAYSLGGGTYTGIEAVSNGVGLMREPRVPTAKRTMLLMAVSLAVTAAGILLSYLLVHASPVEGKTMNAVLLERVAGGWTIGGVKLGYGFVVTALFSEGALLFVAAQAGFVDGPRVMANMAVDSWLPHRFAALSDRLSMRNGVAIMAIAALVALTYTRGDVAKLVVMYSINVFVTFSLSNLAMSRFWIKHRHEHAKWTRHLLAHAVALVLCVTILVITTIEKLTEGGWVTLVVTTALIVVCFCIKRHYTAVIGALRQLDVDLPSPAEVERLAPSAPDFVEGATSGLLEHHPAAQDPDPQKPVAILLVGGYSGLGRHALLTLLRMFPNHFAGVIFVSIAVVDSESFKGADQIAGLEQRTRESLLRYERYARTLELPAASAFAIGTEVAVETEKMAEDLVRRYPRALFVAGQILFEEETLANRLLHNETALMVQSRLQRRGIPMIVVPVRIDLRTRRAVPAPKLAWP
jgi:amino acid transporter